MTIHIVHPIFLTKKNQEKFLPRPKIHDQKFKQKILTIKKLPKKISDIFSRRKKIIKKIFPKKSSDKKIRPNFSKQKNDKLQNFSQKSETKFSIKIFKQSKIKPQKNQRGKNETTGHFTSVKTQRKKQTQQTVLFSRPILHL